jgi:predicted Zn-dependent protease with MMP-like domain
MFGMDMGDQTAPDAGEIERLALAAFEDLPEAFRGAASQVVLRVEEFADEEMLSGLGLEDPFDLTGLYDGVPMTQKSVSDQPDRPDMIWLFRRPILDEWIGRGDVSLADLVGHVVVHELAHHFGWSDEDIASIDEWWT